MTMHSISNKPVVIVTGSTGLIGSRLVNRLSGYYDVVGMDLKPPADTSVGDFVQCDLTSDASVQKALEEIATRHGRRIASVVHLAAYYDFAGEPSDLYEKLTVQGTRRLLAGLKQFDVEQFIFSSSLLVMRPVALGDELTEDHPTEGTWDYPASKLAAEQVIREEHGSIPVVVLRIAGVYDEQGHSIPITQQIHRIYEKQLESYFFPGNAEHGQAFVHLDDLIDCFALAIERRAELDPYEVMLVAEPDVMSYGELQDVIGEELHGHEWPTIRIPKAVAKVGAWAQDQLAGDDETFIKPWMVDLADAHYPVDIRRATEKLGWQPRHRLRETIYDILAFLRRDPAAWRKVNGIDK